MAEGGGTMYCVNFNGYTIPVTLNSKMNGVCNLYSKWDTFEVIADPVFTKEMIIEFLESREMWMNNHIDKYLSDIYNMVEFIDENKLSLSYRNKNKLRKLIKEFILKHESVLGDVNRIYIKSNVRGKWASCTEKCNITFSDLMCYLPEHLVEYIVYHEMIHLSVRNHDDEFYSKMKIQYPDYVEYDKELNAYHYLIAHKEIDDKIKIIKDNDGRTNLN